MSLEVRWKFTGGEVFQWQRMDDEEAYSTELPDEEKIVAISVLTLMALLDRWEETGGHRA